MINADEARKLSSKEEPQNFENPPEFLVEYVNEMIKQAAKQGDRKIFFNNQVYYMKTGPTSRCTSMPENIYSALVHKLELQGFTVSMRCGRGSFDVSW